MSIAASNGGECCVASWNFTLVEKSEVNCFVMSPECTFVTVNFLTKMTGYG